MGTNDTKGKLETIRQDFRAVGMVAKGLVAQVIFSSILPMRREDGRRRRWIFQVNNWLHGYTAAVLATVFGFLQPWDPV